jgi:Helix-turn-helix domain
MKQVTMQDRLLNLLKREWVTPASAFTKDGCFSLAQRVSEWRREGLDIKKRWVDLSDGRRVMSYKWIV